MSPRQLTTHRTRQRRELELSRKPSVRMLVGALDPIGSDELILLVFCVSTLQQGRWHGGRLTGGYRGGYPSSSEGSSELISVPRGAHLWMIFCRVSSLLMLCATLFFPRSASALLASRPNRASVACFSGGAGRRAEGLRGLRPDVCLGHSGGSSCNSKTAKLRSKNPAARSLKIVLETNCNC